MNESDVVQEKQWRRQLGRAYFSGFVVLAIILVLWRIGRAISPFYETLENPFLATFLTVVTLIAAPPLLGLFVMHVINPVFGRYKSWADVIRLEDQLIGGLSRDKNYEVVLVNWPSESVRAIGLMTATFPATEDAPELAAVFTPSAPGTKTGYIRVVPLADVEFTDWTFAQFQAFQWTIGSLAPESIRDLADS